MKLADDESVENGQFPFIQIGLAYNYGVIMVSYSNRYTRMWSWDIATLTVAGFQDLKARPVLRDISPDGKYISYTVLNYRKGTDYMAVSRPPYFHAIFLANVNSSDYNRVYFGEDGVMDVYRGRNIKSYSARCLVEERLQSGCPYEIREHKGIIYTYPIWNLFLQRYYNPRIHCYERWWARLPIKQDWVGTDAKGRDVWIEGVDLIVNGELLIDLSRPEFEEVVPPDWAKQW